MRQETPDPRLPQLVALLYGELSAAEESALREEIARDPALQAEWNALQGTRSILAAWEPEETAPVFVFLEDARSGSPREAERGRGGLRERLARLMPARAWGFAASTATLALLILAGFRVDRVDNGFAFRFGTPPPAVTSVAPPSSGTAYPTDPMGRPGYEGAWGTVDGRALPIGGAPYVTREQFDAFSAQTFQMMASLMSDYERRRQGELAYVLQAFYDDLSGRQVQAYDELRNQIQDVGLGMLEQQTQANRRLEFLADPRFPLRGVPTGDSLQPEKGDQ